MLQRICVLSFLFTILISFSYGQDGKLAGTVYDDQNQPVPYATVLVYDGDLFKYGAQTDNSGRYSIQPVEAGTYRMTVKFLGGEQEIDKIVVLSGQTRTLDVSFVNVNVSSTDTVQITDFEIPVFEKENPSGLAISGSDATAMGTRNVQSLAAITPGIYQADEGDFAITFRGARSNATAYYVDGMKIRGVTNVPQNAISQMQVITGGTPAEFGDFTGGVISITTAAPASRFGGTIELTTSQFLDAYGRNLGALTLSGPLLTRTEYYDDTEYKRPLLGYFISGEIDYAQDSDPASRGIYKLKDGILNDLNQTPLQPTADGLSFTSRANYITNDDFEQIKAKITNEDLRIRGLVRFDFQPTDNILVKAGGFVERIFSDNYDIRQTLFVPDRFNVFRGGAYRGYIRFQQSFQGGEDAKLKNLFYTLQADYQVYQRRFQHQTHQNNFFDYGYVGKFTFDRIPFYRYVDDPNSTISSSPYWQTSGFGFDNLVFDDSETRNPVLANYNNTIIDHVAENGIQNPTFGFFSLDPVITNVQNLTNLAFFQGIRNGSSPALIYSLFFGIGSDYPAYQKFDFEQFRLSGQATAEIGKHNFKAGFEFEQRVERTYFLNARSLWGWMRQYSNFHLNNLSENPNDFLYSGIDYNLNGDGEWTDTIQVPLAYSAQDQSTFDRNLRLKLGLPIDGNDWINIDEYGPDFYSLDMFSPDELWANGTGPIDYYGYDYQGNRTDGDGYPQDFDFGTIGGTPGNFFTDETNRPQKPFSPTYISAFLQDKFEFEDIIFNIGVRVDRFDANQLVLKDNFSLYPVFSALETIDQLGVEAPSTVQSSWVAYVDNASNPTKIVGYRDNDIWLDVDGAPTSSTTIANASGGKPQPHVRDNKVSSESFEDYEPQTTIMPRLSFSFPISDQALFFAHYDVLAQRPGQLLVTQSSFMAGRLSDYAFLENNPTIDVTNPNLKPEVTVDYEAGFKQRIGDRMALSISAFYREQRGMINTRRFGDAWPFTYNTYDNIDFGTVKGFTFQYDMRRTSNIQIRASYTLKFESATGSGFTSSRNVQDFLEGNALLRTLLPTGRDQRHRFTGTFDYRFSGRSLGPALRMGKKTVHPLQDAGLNMTFTLGSGTPFSRSGTVTPSVTSGVVTNAQLQGTPFGSRLAWNFRTDLRVDKTIAFGGKPIEGGGNTRDFSFNVYLSILNLFNTENILGVYGFTGLPETDGWLESDQGKQAIIAQIDPEAYVDQYTIRVNNPSNFSLPRRISIGMFFNF